MAVSCKRAAGMLLHMVILCMPAATVLAQKSEYSLAGLIDSASHHLPMLLQKKALVAGAEAGVVDAKDAFLPRVNFVEELSIGSANDLAGAYLPAPGVLHAVSGGITSGNSYQAGSGNIASIYAEYDLVNFGLRGAKVSNARAYVGVQRADLAKELYMMKWQIAKLWFEIQKARYQLAVDAEDVRRNESMFQVTQALTSSGINAGVDSSLAKAGLSRTRVIFNQTEGRLRVLLQQMNFWTGVSDPAIAADGNADINVVRGVNGLERESGFGMLPGQDSQFFPGTGDTAGERSNPLLDYYNKQQQQYQSETELIRKSYLPKIVVGAGGWARGSSIQYNNDYKGIGEGLGYQRLNYLAGVGFTYDLFNGVRKRDKMAVAAHQAEAAGFAMAQQELALRNAASQAEESMRTARNNLAELPVQIQAARDAYRQKLSQYKAGIINLVDLTNASFVLYQAQSGYIETVNSWRMAGLDKAAATGSLDTFIQSIK